MTSANRAFAKSRVLLCVALVELVDVCASIGEDVRTHANIVANATFFKTSRHDRGTVAVRMARRLKPTAGQGRKTLTMISQ